MERIILHCDANNFYASVACRLNPDLKDKCVAVSGSPEKRHGIILAKNNLAKKMGIKTGDVIWQAKQKCPDLVLVPPQYDEYVKFSNKLFDLYTQYTDRVEPFGIDECWLDVTHSMKIFKSGEAIANELRKRVKEELGLTISVGVSFTKIFAKLGSDLKKPDATTIITKENFKEKVWDLPANDMLMVGRHTYDKLVKLGIHTIGDLATTNKDVLKMHFGINGIKLYEYANGIQDDEVRLYYKPFIPKSIGHSTTLPKDIETLDEVQSVLLALSEMVAIRMRRFKFVANGIQVSLRYTDLFWESKQGKMQQTATAKDIFDEAYKLFLTVYEEGRSIRSLGVATFDLEEEGASKQLTFFDNYDEEKEQKKKKLNEAIDSLRSKYGYNVIQTGQVLAHSDLCEGLQDTDFIPFKK